MSVHSATKTERQNYSVSKLNYVKDCPAMSCSTPQSLLFCTSGELQSMSGLLEKEKKKKRRNPVSSTAGGKRRNTQNTSTKL
ncbi:uncharacterized protein LOC111714902 isoform X4 [Eurytemora carolleeae]|uniref:uncharacterized protein LOC111714902 isoform X4 n=1 Tax=Eurytemora carolleeae TaxID=1294199 RepID=UPI000C765F48|nr:uncharacterized protein LOC111714902 isoform X4 [Eurytemora carolleeae]|eukprot:XP_023345888.1 uncharacterized protein LOC111714902 isoform X4 [Eurytemora affinis]